MAEFMKHYEVLLKKAKVDLKAAQNLYNDISSGDEELDYEVVLFHLHQCAEKFMKFLFERGSLNSSMNRLYYSSFYATSPLLLDKNIEVKSHAGVK